MNKELTKQAIAVMQGYVDGKTIQYRYDEKQEWKTLSPFSNWNWLEADYRIKPEVAKYRRYLYKDDLGRPLVYALTPPRDDPRSVGAIENSQYFIRWIDTEWQELEV